MSAVVTLKEAMLLIVACFLRGMKGREEEEEGGGGGQEDGRVKRKKNGERIGERQCEE